VTVARSFQKRVAAEVLNRTGHSPWPLTLPQIRNAVQKVFRNAGINEVRRAVLEAEKHGQIRRKVVGGKVYYEINPNHTPPAPE